jgi:predicted ATP-dependent protease
MIDIQRETRMGGALHTKGVLILSSFLAARYSARRPLALNASLVFEQSYGPVEGDSATVAEICAVLSALSGLPILQSLAVTGSMNQLGEVQPIGGVNEKIEGFFELCAARGLSGGQGVIVPAANVDHLMLRDDVIRAVADGRFHVHAVSHVDEAVALLTGVPAGTVGAGPGEPSVNGRVAARLRELFELRSNGRAGAGGRGGGRAMVRVVTRDAGGGGAARRRGGGDG